jgi:hypothetical protein
MSFGGLGMAAAVLKLLGSRLTLVLDREGIIHRPSRVPVERVPWDQVTKVEVYSISGNPFIGIDVRDRSVLGDGAVAKAVRAADAGISGCAINVPESLLDCSAKELAELLSRYCASPELREGLALWEPESSKA